MKNEKDMQIREDGCHRMIRESQRHMQNVIKFHANNIAFALSPEKHRSETDPDFTIRSW